MSHRCLSSVASMVVNRNPRNLEKLRIAYRPKGYHLDKIGRNFWHKVEIESSARHVTARVVHFVNGPVVEVSTSEWAVKKQLYSLKDTSAYINLGRILAQRCLRFGIIEMRCDIQRAPDGKLDKFLDNLESGGVRLREEAQHRHCFPNHLQRYEQPWLVHEQEQ